MKLLRYLGEVSTNIDCFTVLNFPTYLAINSSSESYFFLLDSEIVEKSLVKSKFSFGHQRVIFYGHLLDFKK